LKKNRDLRLERPREKKKGGEPWGGRKWGARRGERGSRKVKRGTDFNPEKKSGPETGPWKKYKTRNNFLKKGEKAMRLGGVTH